MDGRIYCCEANTAEPMLGTADLVDVWLLQWACSRIPYEGEMKDFSWLARLLQAEERTRAMMGMGTMTAGT